LLEHRDYICTETQANSLEVKTDGNFPFQVELDEAMLGFELRKV
jgi:hypothetical protein